MTSLTISITYLYPTCSAPSSSTSFSQRTPLPSSPHAQTISVSEGDSSVKECAVCNEEYDENQRCPRNLPCSHCLCEDCIENIIRRNDKKCPFCREPFQGNSARSFKVNNTTLGLVNYIKHLEANMTSPSNMSSMSRLDMANEMKKETLAAIMEGITHCQRTEELVQGAIRSTIILQAAIEENRNAARADIVIKLQKFEEICEEQVKFLIEERGRLASKLRDRTEKLKQLNAAKDNLESATELQKVNSNILKADEVLVVAKKGVKDLEEHQEKQDIIYRSLEKSTTGAQEKVILMKEIMMTFQKEGWNLTQGKGAPPETQSEGIGQASMRLIL
ncbi:hypothetical protein SK128_024716 [Halocaridina rubra]|uniref:RING-type domain-containing protein n=1 Tax=Halocaridina rubra TaxID=373956 RepID=A0AAN9ACR6_HALRR